MNNLECANTAVMLYNMTTNCENPCWRELLQYGETLTLDEKRKFLWTWPTEENIKALKDTLTAFTISNILSIGCGNGLLEWIIKESIGTSVYGLEIDKAWWQSSYAVKNFVDINYIDESNNVNILANSGEYLQYCAHSNNWEFALLFCYFNNRAAFTNYLKIYEGKWIIIIGPMPEVGIYTDPNPLEPNFPAELNWHLRHSFRFSENDIATFYTNQ